MANSTQDIESEDSNNNNFNTQKEFKDLLNHSQHLVWEYKALLEGLQIIINNLDTTSKLLCKDIMDIYSKKIENHVNAILTININFYETNQSPEIKRLLDKVSKNNIKNRL